MLCCVVWATQFDEEPFAEAFGKNVKNNQLLQRAQRERGSERKKFGGSEVLVWKPQAGIDDSIFEELLVEKKDHRCNPSACSCY